MVMMFNPDDYLHQPTDDELLWYFVDLDSTLAEGVWPQSEGIGAPIKKNLVKLGEVYDAGYKIIIHTSRPWGHYQRIEAWLNDVGIPFKGIVCGKPMGFRYVDDRGINSEEDSWLPNKKT